MYFASDSGKQFSSSLRARWPIFDNTEGSCLRTSINQILGNNYFLARPLYFLYWPSPAPPPRWIALNSDGVVDFLSYRANIVSRNYYCLEWIWSKKTSSRPYRRCRRSSNWAESFATEKQSPSKWVSDSYADDQLNFAQLLTPPLSTVPAQRSGHHPQQPEVFARYRIGPAIHSRRVERATSHAIVRQGQVRRLPKSRTGPQEFGSALEIRIQRHHERHQGRDIGPLEPGNPVGKNLTQA